MLIGSKMKPFSSSYLKSECVYSLEIKSAVWRLVQDPFFALTKFVLLVHQVYNWLSSELVLTFQQYKQETLFCAISIRH